MADIPSDKQLSELLGGGESDSGSGLDFGYYFHLLLRYIWLFLAIVLICAAVGAYLALRQPQKYVATAVIQVEQQEQRVLKNGRNRPTRGGRLFDHDRGDVDRRLVSGARGQGRESCQ